MMPLRLSAGAALMAGNLLLAGCAMDGHVNGTVAVPDPGQAMLRFHGPLEDQAVRRIAYVNPWSYEEYASVKTADLRLEMVYIAAVGDNTSIEYPYTRQHMIRTWRYNAGQAMTLDGQDRALGPITDLWFQRYSLTARNESCAGFDAEWDPPSDDPRIRPGKVMFGYLCAAPGQPLSYAQIESVLDNIGIRGITERMRPGDPPPLARGFGDPAPVSPQQQTAALTLARSGPDGVSGTPEFPFDFVVIYTVGDGDGSGNVQ